MGGALKISDGLNIPSRPSDKGKHDFSESPETNGLNSDSWKTVDWVANLTIQLTRLPNK